MICSLLIISTILSASILAKPTTTTTIDPFDLDMFAGAMGDGHFANMEVDGVAVATGKKTEKLPGQKAVKKAAAVSDDVGVAPEFTGSFKTDEDDDSDYFAEATGPVTNPASTFLDGADFEKIATPQCQMLGCTGPIPNDGSYAALSTSLEGKSCSQMFVPMNGCVDNKGYPIGMLCSVCCDCSNPFVTEMRKTFGFKQNIETSLFSS